MKKPSLQYKAKRQPNKIAPYQPAQTINTPQMTPEDMDKAFYATTGTALFPGSPQNVRF